MNFRSTGSEAHAIPTWKRALDVGCCLIALPILGLVALGAWLLTKTGSPGPILFRQERVGHLGRRFYLYKFRTMHVSVDCSVHHVYFARQMKSNAPMEKLDARRDRRLIPGGWLFRATGLDELPQIINVLRGEMSIVGPRPCIPYEYDEYTPAQCARLDSVPGLTGLWQVSGKNRTTFDEMVQLDIAYSQRRSVVLDLQIILRTVPALWVQLSDTRKARGLAQSISSLARDVGRGIPAETSSLANFAGNAP